MHSVVLIDRVGGRHGRFDGDGALVGLQPNETKHTERRRRRSALGSGIGPF